MITARELLGSKGRDVWTTGPDGSVHDAVRMLADKGVGALVVVDGGRVVGIFSERDCVRKILHTDKTLREVPVREWMTPRVVYVQPDQTVEECLALMTDKRIRHLPVMEGDRLIGVLSIGDLVKSMLSHQQFIIQQLEHYISGPGAPPS